MVAAAGHHIEIERDGKEIEIEIEKAPKRREERRSAEEM